MKTFREFISESYSPHSTLMHIDDHNYEELSKAVHNHLSRFLPEKIKNKNYIDNLFHIYNAGNRTPKEVFSYIIHTSEHPSKRKKNLFLKDLYVAHNFSDSAINSRKRTRQATLSRNSIENKPETAPKQWYDI